MREVERRAQGAAAARQRARRQRQGTGGTAVESHEVRALRERAEAHFGSPVTIERGSSGKGRVSVAFFDDVDLARLLSMMGVETRLD